MTPEQYSPLALRTARRFDAHGDFIHAALGLASEVTELSQVVNHRVHVLDEAGDMFWYLNLATVSLGRGFATLDDPEMRVHSGRPMNYLLEELADAVSVVADSAKKLMIAGAIKKHVELKIALRVIFAITAELLSRHALMVGEALHTNILKLSERYPELKFEAERALNVNHEAEAAATRQCTPNQIAESSDDGQCCGKCSNVTGAA